MSKYASKSIQKPKQVRGETHAVWRGIGCGMIVIVPIMSIALGIFLFDYGLANGWSIPYQLTGYPRLPDFVYLSSGLTMVFGPLTRVNNLNGYITFSFIALIVMASSLSFVYSILYRVAGPKTYSAIDVPPPNVKVKKYKR